MQGWYRHLLWVIALNLVVGGLLSACGQKGPLYLPEPEPEQAEQLDNTGS
jgi:predicted small lipoprotein YifL